MPPDNLALEIVVDSPRWRALSGAKILCETAVRAALKAGRVRRNVEIALLLADDSRIKTLNRDWRGKNAPTNVLSFPSGEAPKRGERLFLGDIALAFETIEKEAAREKKKLAHHVSHLVVHGVLHLLGHDHAAPRQARAMERLETGILEGLGIPDPYGEEAR